MRGACRWGQLGRSAAAGRCRTGTADLAGAGRAQEARGRVTGLRIDPHGAQASQTRDAATAVGRVSRRARNAGVALQLLLRTVSILGAPVAALDAPAALGRREAVRRLCG